MLRNKDNLVSKGYDKRPLDRNDNRMYLSDQIMMLSRAIEWIIIFWSEAASLVVLIIQQVRAGKFLKINITNISWIKNVSEWIIEVK